MFSQFGHLIDAAFHGLLLFALDPALGFVPLSLLSRVFLLPFGKCCSPSWHIIPPYFLVRRRQALGSLIGATCALETLPARLARLPRMAAVIVAPTAASTAKTMASTTSWSLRLRFRLVDG